MQKGYLRDEVPGKANLSESNHCKHSCLREMVIGIYFQGLKKRTNGRYGGQHL